MIGESRDIKGGTQGRRGTWRQAVTLRLGGKPIKGRTLPRPACDRYRKAPSWRYVRDKMTKQLPRRTVAGSTATGLTVQVAPATARRAQSPVMQASVQIVVSMFDFEEPRPIPSSILLDFSAELSHCHKKTAAFTD